MNVRILFTGRMYHLASEVPGEINLPDDAEVADAIALLQQTTPEAPLPATCLLAVNGEHLGSLSDYRSRPLRDGDELALIAPVAGG